MENKQILEKWTVVDYAEVKIGSCVFIRDRTPNQEGAYWQIIRAPAETNELYGTYATLLQAKRALIDIWFHDMGGTTTKEENQ